MVTRKKKVFQKIRKFSLFLKICISFSHRNSFPFLSTRRFKSFNSKLPKKNLSFWNLSSRAAFFVLFKFLNFPNQQSKRKNEQNVFHFGFHWNFRYRQRRYYLCTREMVKKQPKQNHSRLLGFPLMFVCIVFVFPVICNFIN